MVEHKKPSFPLPRMGSSVFAAEIDRLMTAHPETRFVVDEAMLAAITKKAYVVGTETFAVPAVLNYGPALTESTPMPNDNQAFARKMALKRGETIAVMDTAFNKGSLPLRRQVSGITAALRGQHQFGSTPENIVTCHSVIDLGTLAVLDRIPCWHSSITLNEQIGWFTGDYPIVFMRAETYALVQKPEARRYDSLCAALCSLIYIDGLKGGLTPARIETTSEELAAGFRATFLTAETEIVLDKKTRTPYVAAIYSVTTRHFNGGKPSLITVDLTSDF